MPNVLWKAACASALVAATWPICGQAATSPEAPAPSDPATATPEALVTALYILLSGPVEKQRDWNRFRDLFRPEARLGSAHGSLRPRTIDEYVQSTGGLLREKGFWEKELRRDVLRFGNVAHIFSAYATWIGSPDGEPVARGINSIQIVRVEGRWQVLSIVWDVETADQPLPSSFAERRRNGRPLGKE